MFYVKKTMEISASHRLDLDYSSPCKKFHGHNFFVTVYCKSDTLNRNGMVIDFKRIKEIVHGKMDHQNLNEVFDFNPTAENIAEWIMNNVPFCYMVKIKESDKNEVCYEI